MSKFIRDCRFAFFMLRANVREDDDESPLTFWEKLGVAAEIILGIIVIDDLPRRK